MLEKEIDGFVKRIFENIGESPSISSGKKYGCYYVSIKNISTPGLFIGKDGTVLRSLQHILNVYAHKRDRNFPMVMLDINGYKMKQIEMLRTIALDAALRVKRTKEPVNLKPMSASARKIIHITLRNYPNIWTYSVGKEPRRYVVVDLKK